AVGDDAEHQHAEHQQRGRDRAADEGFGNAHQCPDSEVRKTLQHPLMRTSESKGHWHIYDSSAALNPKFATVLAAMLCELRVRGTSGNRRRWRTRPAARR